MSCSQFLKIQIYAKHFLWTETQNQTNRVKEKKKAVLELVVIFLEDNIEQMETVRE